MLVSYSNSSVSSCVLVCGVVVVEGRWHSRIRLVADLFFPEKIKVVDSDIHYEICPLTQAVAYFSDRAKPSLSPPEMSIWHLTTIFHLLCWQGKFSHNSAPRLEVGFSRLWGQLMSLIEMISFLKFHQRRHDLNGNENNSYAGLVSEYMLWKSDLSTMLHKDSWINTQCTQ